MRWLLGCRRRGGVDPIAVILAVGFLSLLAAAVLPLVGCRGVLSSHGTRDGVVQKFSEKGVICNSWEGELALPGFQSPPWEFSVVDGNVVKELRNLGPGRMVRIHYTQHRWLNRLAADTPYTADKIELLD